MNWELRLIEMDGTILDIIEALEKRVSDMESLNPAWIPVQDDLPRPNQWVLAWDTERHTTSKAYYFAVQDFRVPDDGCNGGWRSLCVSHWMRLPQPPRDK